LTPAPRVFDAGVVAARDVMERYIDAMRHGDRAAAFAHYADDVVGHVPGRSALAGDLYGKEAVVGYIETALAHAPGGVEIELVDMLASEERVALIVRERLHDGNRVLDMGRANVYRVERDKIVEISIFESDQYAVDEFLSGGPS
jgi:ketosteroid isomerase-like protein